MPDRLRRSRLAQGVRPGPGGDRLVTRNRRPKADFCFGGSMRMLKFDPNRSLLRRKGSTVMRSFRHLSVLVSAGVVLLGSTLRLGAQSADLPDTAPIATIGAG